jgi:predicted metal-dependent enzyme (double-stranded beta helix superfamily)
MVYNLENLVADCQAALKTQTGAAALEQVRLAAERILDNPDFIAAHFSGEREPSRATLYHDPELDFYVYAHILDGAKVSPPHDHASAWAVYGQAIEYTEMTEWDLADGAELPEPRRSYRLQPGMAGYFDVGQLHSIDLPDGSRFMRITATNIDDLTCRYFHDVDVRQAIAQKLGE